jgi:hypothetical protein
MGGYGRAIWAAAMMSGVSINKLVPGMRLPKTKTRLKVVGCLPAEEYVPDALGVLYGLGAGCVE